MGLPRWGRGILQDITSIEYSVHSIRFFALMAIYSAVMTFVKIFILQLETVSATDPDEGGNGQFRYSIESGDPDDQFSIDGMNASVTNQGPLTLH